jgi:hypothetical protein
MIQNLDVAKYLEGFRASKKYLIQACTTARKEHVEIN